MKKEKTTPVKEKNSSVKETTKKSNVDAVIEAENSNPVITDEATTKSDANKTEETPKVTKIGTMLKEMRLAKGLKIADISKKLCIRKLYLEAIEDSNYKEIPDFPYGIGFIRSYAAFLGLNGENIVELYKEETNSAEPKDMMVLEPQPEATMPGGKYLLISVLAIFVIYGLWSAYNNSEEEIIYEEENIESQALITENNDAEVIVVEEFNAGEENNVEEVSNDAPKVEEDTKLKEQETSQIMISEEKYEAPAEDKKQEKQEKAPKVVVPNEGVFIEALEETWVEVKDDTKLYLSKVLYQGDSYKVPNTKGIILSFGKHNGANVYVNGILTPVTRPNKKTNISLDKILNKEN